MGVAQGSLVLPLSWLRALSWRLCLGPAWLVLLGRRMRVLLLRH
jgi:hypothetical protein